MTCARAFGPSRAEVSPTFLRPHCRGQVFLKCGASHLPRSVQRSTSDSSCRRMPSSSRPAGALPVVLGALTGGLLSSSCCVLQLLLNWASIGCVGFSALTPYRGAFRGLTGALLAYLLYSQGLNRHSVATLLLSTALMVSQDVVAVHNRGEALPRSVQDALQRARWRQHGRQQQPPAATRTQLAVTGLRCEACAARLRRSLAAVPGVDGCTVAFNEGLVEVWSNRSQPVGVAELRDAVAATDSSYSVTDVSRVCFDASEQRQPCGAERHAAVQHSEAAAAGSSAADGKQEL